eukprot:3343958-Pleurochrysis_carterae.AAC.10
MSLRSRGPNEGSNSSPCVKQGNRRSNVVRGSNRPSGPTPLNHAHLSWRCAARERARARGWGAPARRLMSGAQCRRGRPCARGDHKLEERSQRERTRVRMRRKSNLGSCAFECQIAN